jgi:hypothetical protein
MPQRLVTRVEAFDSDDAGRFNFDVSISLPVLGLVVHYQGSLAPAGFEAPGNALLTCT